MKIILVAIIAICLIAIVSVIAIGTAGPTATPTPTPTATPTPTPTPIPMGDIQAVNVTIIPNNTEGGRFAGFIENMGASYEVCMNVNIQVYNDADIMVGQSSASFIWLYLLPGERFPFITTSIYEPLTSWERYEVIVDTTVDESKYWYFRLYPEIQVISHQREGDAITGTLVNGGQESATVKVYAVGYNSSGDIISIKDDVVTDVPPNTQALFRINYWYSEISDIASYDLFTKAIFLH